MPVPVHRVRARLPQATVRGILRGRRAVLVTLDVASGLLITHIVPDDGTVRVTTADVARWEIPLYIKGPARLPREARPDR